MDFSRLFSIIGIILNAFGSVLCIWKLLTTKVECVGTAAEHDNRPAEFRVERKYVRIGLFLILVGAVLQIIGLFV